jgi:argininosuccinate lyase
MGSGALAGSALELDRKFTAEKLGFRSVSSNSMDAVSDRDFMVETAACLSIIAVHLSRVSEDLILYSTDEFAYIEIGGAYCTGSSLMPQKKNPDVFELIRGRAGGVISGLNSLLILLKGLPHTYNRDLQEDKKALFSSFVTVETSLSLMSRAVGTIKVDRERGAAALDSEFIYATDIAEYLVKKGAAFKDAHDIVGGIVRSCLERRINISDLSISELKGFSGLLEEDVYSLLEASVSVGNKRTAGSTNPKMVSGEIKRWNELLRSEDA